MTGVAPEAGHVDLGGPVVPTWSFGGQVPGPEIRLSRPGALRFLMAEGHCHNLYHAPQGGMMAMLSYAAIEIAALTRPGPGS